MSGQDDAQTSNALGRALHAFFRDAGAAGRGIVSTREAIRRVRTEVPACGLGDVDLGDLVARRAIEQGYDVSFDHREDAA